MDDADVAEIVKELDGNFKDASKHANHLLDLIREVFIMCQPALNETTDVTVFKHALTSHMIESLERML